MFKILILAAIVLLIIYYIFLFGSIFFPSVFPKLRNYTEHTVSYIPFKYVFFDEKSSEDNLNHRKK